MVLPVFTCHCAFFSAYFCVKIHQMKFLVTGGSGFIGSHLVEKLRQGGHSVINVDNFDNFYDYRIKIRNTLESLGKSPEFEFSEKSEDLKYLQQQTESENYQLYPTDIRHLEELRKIFSQHSFDMVVHLAALAGVRPSIERPLDYQAVNIQGSLNLWELCREFGVKKFIMASSSSVYGNNEKVPFAEDDVVDFPISPYAATKKCGEVMGHTYHHLYGLDMVQLRFFTVYGPRQRPDLAIHKFARLISEGQEIPFYGDGATARDYTFISDIISGIMGAIHYLEEHSGVYEIINLGESEVVTLNQMVQTLESALHTTARRKPLPPQPGDVQRTNADITKARRLLSYAPQTNFQNGIKIFVEWFLANRRQSQG